MLIVDCGLRQGRRHPVPRFLPLGRGRRCAKESAALVVGWGQGWREKSGLKFRPNAVSLGSFAGVLALRLWR